MDSTQASPLKPLARLLEAAAGRTKRSEPARNAQDRQQQEEIMDGTPGRNAGIDQVFAQGVLEALRQQSEDNNAERREEMQLMLRSAMLDRQELQQQMRDAMLQMQEATAEQTRQLREVMAEKKAEKSQQIPAAA